VKILDLSGTGKREYLKDEIYDIEIV